MLGFQFNVDGYSDWLRLEKGGLLLIFTWNVALFTHAMQKSFTRPDGFPFPMRCLGIFAVLTAAVNVVVMSFAMTVPALRLGAATTALVASQVMFRFAIRATCSWRLSLAFSEDVPKYLNRTGPYRWIRHPLYTSYLLTWIGGFVATAHVASFACLVGMIAFYRVAAVREERKFLRSPLAATYQNYQQTTGMFVPSVRFFLLQT